MTQTVEAPALRRQRMDALDVLRSLAALAVVVIHMSASVLLNTPAQARGFQVAGFLNQFARYAVPAFIFATGAALFYNYGKRTDFSGPQFFGRRLISLGLPYLFWSAVYFGYYQWIGRDFGHLVPRFLAALASANAVYTFYFFPIIVPFYLLFPLVRPLARSRWTDWVALVALLGNGFVVWFAFPHPKFSLGPFLSELYPYGAYTPLWWMGPFFLGVWVAHRWEFATRWLRRFWPHLAVLSAGLLYWTVREFWSYVRIGKLAYVATNFRPSAYWYGLALMLTIVGAGLVLVERGGWLKRAVISFSRYSFAVFLVHPLMMEMTAHTVGLLDLGPLLHFALQMLLVLGLSYLAARLIEKVPGGGWVIGLR